MTGLGAPTSLTDNVFFVLFYIVLALLGLTGGTMVGEGALTWRRAVQGSRIAARKRYFGLILLGAVMVVTATCAAARGLR